MAGPPVRAQARGHLMPHRLVAGGDEVCCRAGSRLAAASAVVAVAALAAVVAVAVGFSSLTQVSTVLLIHQQYSTR